MDEKGIEKQGIIPLQAELNQIDSLKNKKQIAVLMAHFARINVNSPIGLGIEQDMKNLPKWWPDWSKVVWVYLTAIII